jgi:SIR2-like domain
VEESAAGKHDPNDDAPPPLSHYSIVARKLAQCRVVPLLGAGVNRCGRANPWKPRETLPDGGELASYLAKSVPYPDPDVKDLLRVSQYYSVMVGTGALYDELRDVFGGNYSPTPVHKFLAQLPKKLKKQESLAEHQLIVTTNYDDALERAFIEEEEPFDLLIYVAEGRHRGRLVHHPPRVEPRPEPRPVSNAYRGVSLEERTVILKMHGAIDREHKERDSYVIAEDDYVDYLTRDIARVVPAKLAEKLRNSHFLFLGYSLRDWNLRVILHRIWGGQRLTYKSWAIQLNVDDIDEKLWETRGVELFGVDLGKYVQELSRHVAGRSG